MNMLLFNSSSTLLRLYHTTLIFNRRWSRKRFISKTRSIKNFNINRRSRRKKKIKHQTTIDTRIQNSNQILTWLTLCSHWRRRYDSKKRDKARRQEKIKEEIRRRFETFDRCAKREIRVDKIHEKNFESIDSNYHYSRSDRCILDVNQDATQEDLIENLQNRQNIERTSEWWIKRKISSSEDQFASSRRYDYFTWNWCESLYRSNIEDSSQDQQNQRNWLAEYWDRN